jgi:integrase
MYHPTDTPSTFTAVSGHTRLFRRDGGTYYLRAKVPAVLRPIIKKTEERISLRTKELKEALRKVKIESLRVDREFEAAEAELKRLKPPEKKLSREELLWIVKDFVVKQDQDSLTWTGKALEDFSPLEISATADDLINDAVALDSFSKNSHPLETDNGARYLDIYLRGEGKRWGIVPDSDDYTFLLREFRKAKVEILNRSIDRLHERRPIKRDFDQCSADTILPPPPHQNISLGEYLIEFMEYQKNAHSQNTPSVYKVPTRVLSEVLGKDTSLASITKQDIAKVCEVMKQVPVNMTQRYPGLSVENAIKSAERLGDKRRIAPRTLKNYYNNISSIFSLACDEGYIRANPAKSRKLRETFKLEKKPAEPKLFTLEELKTIFHSPLYTGCIDDNEEWGYYRKPGPDHPRNAKFWLPLLALFHGFRLNEVCQLYVEDVGSEKGISFLNIREDLDDEQQTEKRIKTASSWRKVPLHPEIIKMGFLDYVEERRNDTSSTRLFPTILIDEKTGTYSHGSGRWFVRFFEAACGYKPKANFHSFRHHFATSLHRAGVSETTMKKLGGWALSGVMNRVYVHGELPVLFEGISKVEYPGLDLSHLYTPQAE